MRILLSCFLLNEVLWMMPEALAMMTDKKETTFAMPVTVVRVMRRQ